MENFKIFYCPQCKRKVGKHNLNYKTDTRSRCNKCHKRVVYRVATGEVEIVDRRDSLSPSGKLFC
jgi:DNA-directed RNA polymerase subunit RPC12/RpoP